MTPIGKWLCCVLKTMWWSGFVQCVEGLMFISKLQLTIGGCDSEYYINIILIFQCSAYKKLNTTADGKVPKIGPQWLELKTHVQCGGYECGYYVMHWMGNIIGVELKSDWSVWFGDGSALDPEAITTLRKKWAAYFLKLRTIQCTKLVAPLMVIIFQLKYECLNFIFVFSKTLKYMPCICICYFTGYEAPNVRFDNLLHNILYICSCFLILFYSLIILWLLKLSHCWYC
ncbi:hypothetical protein HKD37_10G028422 [Glycine soja]